MEPGNSYHGPKDGIFTALGRREAIAFLRRAEGLDGSALDDYKLAVAKSRMNIRAVLQAVEAGEFLR